MKLKVLYSLFLFLPLLSHGQEIEEFIRFSARNATQAVAVDSQYIYTISNSRIEKTHQNWRGKRGPLGRAS